MDGHPATSNPAPQNGTLAIQNALEIPVGAARKQFSEQPLWEKSFSLETRYGRSKLHRIGPETATESV
jgi:hypothetical protein